MNKKFFTLLSAFAVVCVSAFAQAPDEDATVATTITEGEYYYLGDVDATNVLTLVSSKVTPAKDSLVYAKRSKVEASADQRNALWTIKKTETTPLGDYYAFTNVGSGKVLSLGLGASSIITDPVETTANAFGWTPTEAGKPFTYIKGTDKYALNRTTSNDTLSLKKDATGLDIVALVPGWRKMKVDELNAINNFSFELKVGGTTSATTQAIASRDAINGKFQAEMAESDSTVYYLKDNDITAKRAYLNVDTVYYERTGVLVDSTKANGGLVLAFDSIEATKAPVGKKLESFKFTIWRNVKDSIIIAVANVPTAQANKTFNASSSEDATTGFITLVGFDGTTKALTASAGVNADIAPSVSITLGEKFLLPAGKYFISNAGNTADKGKYYVHGLEKTLLDAVTTGKLMVDKAQTSALVPSTQWSLAEASMTPTFTNRETGADFDVYVSFGKSAEEGIYYYNGDTVKLEAVVTNDPYLGYKKFGATAEIEKVTTVALKFNTALNAEGAFVYVAESDSILGAKELETKDALFFNITPVDSFYIGGPDSLIAVSYSLTNGEDTLAYDATAKAYKLGKANAQKFVFRATATEGQYQILPVKSKEGTYIKDAVWTLDGQASVSGTSALVVNNPDYAILNGLFSLEAPVKPEYMYFESGHKRISSVENTTLAISMNNAEYGVLKGEGESKVGDDGFTKENFSMYLDLYKTDAKKIKPLYLIQTQQTGELTDADARFTMYDMEKVSGLDSVKFKEIKRAGTDGLDLMNGTTKENVDLYTFAFMKTEAGDQYLLENQKDAKFLAQKNGVLHLVGKKENALPFFVKDATDLPTGNEAPEADAVKVIAGTGNVTIQNAEGKVVTINNILGRTIAKTVITSDNATIAAPAGIVVVSVDGSDAVKAIVK